MMFEGNNGGGSEEGSDAFYVVRGTDEHVKNVGT